MQRKLVMTSEIDLISKDVPSVISEQSHMKLIEIAISKGADITQLEKLMDLQERYEANIARKEFNAAMSEFQSGLPVIGKSGTVDYTTAKGRTNYEYAKIEDIAKAIRPSLKTSKLSYRFKQSQDANGITVCCVVTHSSGHSESNHLTAPPDLTGGKDTLKAIASTISYLKRYTLTGGLGIIVGGEDDDDGAASMPKNSSSPNIDIVAVAKECGWTLQQVCESFPTPLNSIKEIQDLKACEAYLRNNQPRSNEI
jgi:hypothetical protein